jgi:hypothetical protein
VGLGGGGCGLATIGSIFDSGIGAVSGLHEDDSDGVTTSCSSDDCTGCICCRGGASALVSGRAAVSGFEGGGLDGGSGRVKLSD